MCAEYVGPYRTLQLLGRGSFGEVWLAEGSRPGHLVALKVGSRALEFEHASIDSAHDVVLREGELLRRLKHPHIVSCEDVGWDADRQLVWLALELLDGGSVRNLIDSRSAHGTPFQAHFVRRVLLEISGALEYIHAEGVLHRDVKPANILLTLTAPPVLKLADFGISKLLEGSGHAHTMVGTQYYSSPELAAGQPYGRASDAWALGVCLYELATLRKPFTASSILELASCIRDEPFPPLPADTAPDCADAISGLLEKNPTKRLQLQDAMMSLEREAATSAPSAVREEEASQESPHGLAEEELELEPAQMGVAQPHAPSVAFGGQGQQGRKVKERQTSC
eukprot:TRINITY_DN29658_c0_g1_i2.p1 TRINITY_DN29658_c0_g1~~TRINITY_DN29658_c0_g1_i2.p1  ORF type:complete len:338 (-),score=74.72 TRINITY_DN29658_c0_g1_i2:70-1083(-)